MKVFKVLTLVMLALLLGAVPMLAVAQEIVVTVEPTGASVTATPEGEQPPVVVVLPTPAPTQYDSLDIAIVIGIVILIVSALVMIFRGTPPAQVDAWTTAQIKAKQEDRLAMERMELRYAQLQNTTLKTVTTLVKGMLAVVAPMTGATSDDAFLDFIEDVEEEGEPDAPPITGQTVNTNLTNAGAHQ